MHSNKGSKSPIRMNPMNVTQTPYNQKVVNMQKNNFNTSYGNYPTNFRHS